MFGELVRAHRRRLGITQEELADRTGVSVRGIGNLEAGRTSRPRAGTVRRLADAFGLSGADRDRFCAAAASPDPVPDILGEPTRRPSPAQLPPDVAGFAGRAEQLRQLDMLLDHGDGRPTAVAITAIAGTAGVGKTALAVRWAHRVRDRFPDGQLYVNLRGFDPSGTAMNPAEAVRRFLDALDVAPQRIPADLDAQAALYRTLLADRRMLVVLDNARDADQVRPLLAGAPGCLVLITSRNQLPSIVAAEGAHSLTLDLLTPEESRQLLVRRLGRDRVAAEPEAVDEIITQCARLPLALAIVATRAAIHPHFPLTALAGELGDSRDRLDALAGGDPATDVRAVFSWSYCTLTPDAARLFRLLGLHPGPDISAAAAASLAGLPAARVRPLLGELARVHLVVEHIPARYTLHDLLRAYATELAHGLDPSTDGQAATRRMLDYYLHSAHSADLLLGPHRDPITIASPQPGVTPERPADHDQALAWFATERPVLLAVVDHAANTGFDTYAWQLAWTVIEFLDRRGHWRDWVATQHAALEAARRLGDPRTQARAHRLLARAYTQLSRDNDAHTHYTHALDLYGRAGDQVGQAHTHLDFAVLWERQARYAEALHHAQLALEVYRAAGHQQGQPSALNAVGWYHAQLGDHRQALAYCHQALKQFQEIGARVGEAATWDSLGYVHHHLGDHTQAITCYQHALDLYRDIGDRYYEADSHTHLGDTHQVTGDADAARAAYRRALQILEELDHADADSVRTKLRRVTEQHGTRSEAGPDERG